MLTRRNLRSTLGLRFGVADGVEPADFTEVRTQVHNWWQTRLEARSPVSVDRTIQTSQSAGLTSTSPHSQQHIQSQQLKA